MQVYLAIYIVPHICNFLCLKDLPKEGQRAFMSAVSYTAGIKDSIHLTDKPIQEALYLNSESNRY